jgi:hypothetical protein
MARKDFPFDFNEDADPVDEIHRLRVAAARHFKTMKEHLEYLHATPTAEECLAELDAEIAAQRARAARSRPPPTARRPRQKAKA